MDNVVVCDCGCGLMVFEDDGKDFVSLAYYPYAGVHLGFFERLKIVWNILVGNMNYLFDMAVKREKFFEAVYTLKNEIGVLERMKRFTKEGGWLPYPENKPEDGKFYEVTAYTVDEGDKDYFVDIARYTEVAGWHRPDWLLAEEYSGEITITAFRSQPEPYQAESED